MTTYRERREARAERLTGWAEKRDAKATADLARARTMGEAIPFGQPILIGHHSERADRGYRGRMVATMDRGVAHARKAQEMAGRAATIEAQLAVSIYDDDPDAIERLRERVATLEAERDRIKAFNVTARKGAPDLTLLTDREKRSLALDPMAARRKGQMPGYHLANLSGNIKRNRDRLARLEARA